MATPIQPNTGSVPQLPPVGGMQKLKQTAIALLRAAVTYLPFAPNPQKAVEAVKQEKRMRIDLEGLINMTPPVRNIILTNLPDNELKALEIALSKGTTVKDTHKVAFKTLHAQIQKIQQDRKEQLLKEIMADHPTWKSEVESWKEVSIDDKIWLLQIRELSLFGVKIPDVDFLPNLLKPEKKEEVTKALAEVVRLDLATKSLQKCTQAIGLLGNLKVLLLANNRLTTPPNVSRNPNLETLSLTNNLLTTPPDVSYNPKLTSLQIVKNQLTVPPDVTKNVKLEQLVLGGNKLTTPPDVSKNIYLNDFNLSDNQLTTCPDVSQNINLIYFYLENNQIVVPPDVSKNVNLKQLSLIKNRINSPPDVSKNILLTYLGLAQNPLSDKEALAKLIAERHPKLHIPY